MAMDTSTDQELPAPVTNMELIDVSGVRDSGMQALVLLARSLDWNVHQKVNNPVIITSRSGVQRRIPTNTSIRMSVFQTHLSAIMLHSSLEATIELMDQIIKSTKPNREQANRLRLAVGQSVQEHRRQTEDAAIPPAVEQGGPLTQNIEIEWEEPPMTETNRTVEARSTILGQIVHGAPVGVAADGKDHGKVVSRAPFIASINSVGKSRYVYESKSSYERIWEDGYYDYECMICGVAYPKPKGVGSHRQTHVKYDGAERLNQKSVIEATKRAPTPEEYKWIIDRDHGGVEPEHKSHKKADEPTDAERAQMPYQGSPSPTVIKEPKERVKAPPVPDVIAANAKPRVVEEAQSPGIEPSAIAAAMEGVASDRMAKVLEILLPEATELMAILTEENQSLRVDNEALRKERDKLRSDLSTLKDLVGGLG